MRREHDILESFKSLHKTRAQLAQEEIRKINEAAAAKDNFVNDYYKMRDSRINKEAQHAKLMEAARNDGLATVLKAIYITAMEAEAMTDNGILLAERMVDGFIDEQGGASNILNAKVANKTYLLSRITQIVENYATTIVNEIESDSEEIDDEVEDIKVDEDKEKEPIDSSKIEDIKDFVDNADKDDLKEFIFDMVAKIKDKAEEEADEEVDDAVEDAEEEAAEESESEEAEETEEELDDTEEEVEDAAEEADAADEDTESETQVEEEESEDEEKEEEDTEDETEDKAGDDESEEETDTKAETDEEETSEEDTEDESEEADEEESSDDDEVEDAEEDDITEVELSDDEVDADEDEFEDDDIEDELGEPLDDDETDADITVDGDTENNGQIFDDLKKEDDVQKAIELIRTRVANAEETFIRNNAEDKKKIDELLNKISNNVKTVEDLEGKNDAKAEVAKESARIAKSQINAIKSSNKILTVFEKMSRLLGENIIKNPDTKDMYLEENGNLDVDLVVESAKVMYGFLETLNTLQLVDVNEEYIAGIIDDMKHDR